ncbi:P-loop containing nucleoside triphosphate hydrolase protein, partial [Mycotypha africana]|uniref:P-loop containing nucleoside triphosphate hydrolase protein n=1 Tax=Mycotypha africana TaxID=64632 RepID=UPI00230183D2
NHTDHLSIHIPNPGACYMQDHIVCRLAQKVKAHLLVLDPQDFIYLAQHSFKKDAARLLPVLSASDPLSNILLALRQHNHISNSKDNASKGEAEEETVEIVRKDDNTNDDDDVDDDEYYYLENEDTDSDDDPTAKAGLHHLNKTKAFYDTKAVDLELDVDDFINRHATNYNKRSNNRVTTTATTALMPMTKEPKIIYLRDYSGMQDAFTRTMLKSLVMAVEDLRQNGHPIMFVASHTGAEDTLQRQHDISSYYLPPISNMRSMAILPSVEDENQYQLWKDLMDKDRKKRITEINSKGFLAMLDQKSVKNLSIQERDHLLDELLSIANDDGDDNGGISKFVWAPEDIDRRVSAAIGHALEQKKSKLEFSDIKASHDIVKQVSEVNVRTWKTIKRMVTTTDSLPTLEDGTLNLDQLKKSCNEYERKLLSRVVDPSKVYSSFKDVRAPPQTIETLQMLISLPLIRPDLFQKGLLKKNFIPGVLLFGPPGTGKTMLAKAVAKDSGSRMLDIQASDVYDMYVGQGEKNVKAIFSLARKLSPCVIFIDEVDSLMNQRGSDYSSKSHREIINQFMVEWDGISSNNQGVIVMAATNRPFDLDDAVLRRMPRRILVDLPNEEDRKEILNILLQDENLQEEVSIDRLAKLTEHYSGSDLKNVCVTAALKAVQQEVATKESQTLSMKHFEEAIKMVPPSSSEEMDSLIEIRKWDS